jgi:riboflavin kinase/FMN adenylyltransferase
MPYGRKMRALGTLGLDFVLEQRFDSDFAVVSAEDFARVVLADALRASAVVVGDDFTFGRDRRGVVEDLAELGIRYGFEVEVVRRLCVEGMAVSSTRIRSFLLQGKARGAAVLLGRPFLIEGEVVGGKGRGRRLGIPTANIETTAEIIPARGVYATRVWIEGENAGYLGAASIGTNPTFGPGELTVEVHVLDFDGELAGRRMAVAFLEHLRAEQAFSSAQALVEQIEQDTRETRKVGRSAGITPEPHPLDGIQLDRQAPSHR